MTPRSLTFYDYFQLDGLRAENINLVLLMLTHTIHWAMHICSDVYSNRRKQLLKCILKLNKVKYSEYWPRVFVHLLQFHSQLEEMLCCTAHVRPYHKKQCSFYWHFTCVYATSIKCHRVHSHCSVCSLTHSIFANFFLTFIRAHMPHWVIAD